MCLNRMPFLQRAKQHVASPDLTRGCACTWGPGTFRKTVHEGADSTWRKHLPECPWPLALAEELRLGCEGQPAGERRGFYGPLQRKAKLPGLASQIPWAPLPAQTASAAAGLSARLWPHGPGWFLPWDSGNLVCNEARPHGQS